MTSRCLWGLFAALWSLAPPAPDFTPASRLDAIRRAQVWTPTDVAAFDFTAGGGEFAPWATIACDHVVKEYGGKTPKFGCALAPGDDVKVKYGDTNSEVYAGVAATRLVRALGFGVDALHPVSIDCRGCPAELGGTPAGPGVRRFEVAAFERKLKGKDVKVNNEEGWKWAELDLVDPAAGGAPRAHRDALKLLMVFLQNGDNKASQQKMVCPSNAVKKDAAGNETCEQPLLYVQDLGYAFGKGTPLSTSKNDLEEWSEEPIWKDSAQCLGNLKKSLIGTLKDPPISEEGRKFLADLLVQLSDKQITDMFTAARVERFHKHTERNEPISDWVRVFKKKRDEIVNTRCPS
jgi:hypothetical protein